VVKVEVGLLPAAAVTRDAFCTRREAVGMATRTRRRRRTGWGSSSRRTTRRYR